jgi:CBS domain-containing protein
MSTRRSVRDAMSPNPLAVDPDLSVVDAARIMLAQDVGSLPVVQGERLIGLVTDRDIALRVVAEGKDPRDLPVGGIASRELMTVTPEQPLDEALRLMATAKVRRLPVVEESHRLVGILAQADVARTVDERSTGEVVERISEPTREVS